MNTPTGRLPGSFMRQRLFIGGGSLFIRQTHPGTPFLILGKTVGVVLINQAQGPLFAGKPSGEGARILPADIHHRVVFSLGKAGPGRSFPSGSFQEFLKVLYAHFVVMTRAFPPTGTSLMPRLLVQGEPKTTDLSGSNCRERYKSCGSSPLRRMVACPGSLISMT